MSEQKPVQLLEQKKHKSAELSGSIVQNVRTYLYSAHNEDRVVKTLAKCAFRSILEAQENRGGQKNILHRSADICANVPTYQHVRREVSRNARVHCHKSYTNTANMKAARMRSIDAEKRCV